MYYRCEYSKHEPLQQLHHDVREISTGKNIMEVKKNVQSQLEKFV